MDKISDQTASHGCSPDRKFNKTTITPERQGMGTYSFQLSLLSLRPDYRPDSRQSVQTLPLSVLKMTNNSSDYLSS
jgi:hypothetical protein